MTPKKKTTAKNLSGIIKSARDIMRKDKGLSGDLDRLPMLTWIMFLKFLDDMEHVREEEAIMRGSDYKPTLAPPYRWRDWADNSEGATGDDLLAFINNDEAMRPDGTSGAGLFQYLKNLESENGRSRKDVVAIIFSDVQNRMKSGYLLRDVINKVNEIHFTSSQEIYTLSHLYESMLKEMRDAAGDSGEFYTPRPVVKLMVELTSPELGEIILDPACGTGGFLVETYEYIKPSCKTIEDHEAIQSNIRGGEAKPLPYLLGQMNLMLHGIEFPVVDPENSLRHKITEIGDSERVDIILTNPPFGGEEEAGIQGNFPGDKQTAETALLFLQLIMRMLKRPSHEKSIGGRAAVVVPNGTLFADGVAARIKHQLVSNFNMHTIIRLPSGVFSPYTNIPTNLLFFNREKPTSDIWFYEHPLPEGKKNYTKTKPLMYSEFHPLIEWWNERKVNDFAWQVSIEDVLLFDNEGNLTNVNLDQKNPNSQDAKKYLPPGDLISEIQAIEIKINEIVSEIHEMVNGEPL